MCWTRRARVDYFFCFLDTVHTELENRVWRQSPPTVQYLHCMTRYESPHPACRPPPSCPLWVFTCFDAIMSYHLWIRTADRNALATLMARRVLILAKQMLSECQIQPNSCLRCHSDYFRKLKWPVIKTCIIVCQNVVPSFVSDGGNQKAARFLEDQKVPARWAAGKRLQWFSGQDCSRRGRMCVGTVWVTPCRFSLTWPAEFVRELFSQVSLVSMISMQGFGFLHSPVVWSAVLYLTRYMYTDQQDNYELYQCVFARIWGFFGLLLRHFKAAW